MWTINLFVLFILVSLSGAQVTHDVIDQSCNLSEKLVKEIRSYQPIVDSIILAVTDGQFKGEVYKELANFVDKFGARQAGSKNLENSIDYLLEHLRKFNLENVHGENASVSHWVRGKELCRMLSPRKDHIGILAIGGSVSTPEGGVQADAIVVQSFEHLQQVNEKVKGKIVVFNYNYTSYVEDIKYRVQGASNAAKYGAVAVLVRSLTDFSLHTLHTGLQIYEKNVTKIPAASITKEDARMLQRIQDRGDKITLKLFIETETHPDVMSRNIVADLQGKILPKKNVILSGHIDSWDVGVGAMDDGGGAFISWYALVVLSKLKFRARRTVRAVLWTAEETFYQGFTAYNETHKHELDDITFAFESDEGTFTPLGIQYATGKKGGCIIQEIAKLLHAINATQTKSSSAVGSDIANWAGLIPTGALLNANDKYFYYHHTEADTMDVMNPDALDKSTALWAAAAFVIADLSEEFPRDFSYI